MGIGKKVLIGIGALVVLGILFSCAFLGGVASDVGDELSPKAPVSVSSDESAQSAADETQDTTETQVATLDLFGTMGENWDADADVDGLEVELRPLDSSDSLVKTAGTVHATLYNQNYNPMGDNTKGSEIQSWDVSISEDDFDFWSVVLRLEYKADYQPSDMDMGWFELTLTTPDGKTFEVRDDSVFVAGLG